VACLRISERSAAVWEIPVTHKEGMRVPARIVATEKLLQQMDDGVFDQVTNVATLPGILNTPTACPTGHWGMVFPSARGGNGCRDGCDFRVGSGLTSIAGMRLILTTSPTTKCNRTCASWSIGLFTRVPRESEVPAW